MIMQSRKPGVTNLILTDIEGECLYEFFILLGAESVEVSTVLHRNMLAEDVARIEQRIAQLKRLAPALKAKLGDTHGSF